MIVHYQAGKMDQLHFNASKIFDKEKKLSEKIQKFNKIERGKQDEFLDEMMKNRNGLLMPSEREK